MGKKHGFNFNENKNKTIGVLRDFVRRLKRYCKMQS
jgi:hypothetical protein